MPVPALCAVWLAMALLIGGAAPAAGAGFDAKDGQILGRMLGYVGDGKSGVAVVGVVFSPTNRASQQELELVQSVIGDGLVTGRIRLQVRPVPVEQLAAVTGLSALYLTDGVTGDVDAIFDAAKRLQVPTVSASLGCVGSGRCVVGFTSEPTVQILLNQEAAERLGVHFLQAFRMLVREK